MSNPSALPSAPPPLPPASPPPSSSAASPPSCPTATASVHHPHHQSHHQNHAHHTLVHHAHHHAHHPQAHLDNHAHRHSQQPLANSASKDNATNIDNNAAAATPATTAPAAATSATTAAAAVAAAAITAATAVSSDAGLDICISANMGVGPTPNDIDVDQVSSAIDEPPTDDNVDPSCSHGDSQHEHEPGCTDMDTTVATSGDGGTASGTGRGGEGGVGDDGGGGNEGGGVSTSGVGQTLTRKAGGKGLGWNTSEMLALARAVVTTRATCGASMSSIKFREQTRLAFLHDELRPPCTTSTTTTSSSSNYMQQTQAHQLEKDRGGDFDVRRWAGRSVAACFKRWIKVRAECGNFRKAVRNVTELIQMHQSLTAQATSEIDIERCASYVYNGGVATPDSLLDVVRSPKCDVGKPFPFLDVYRYLINHSNIFDDGAEGCQTHSQKGGEQGGACKTNNSGNGTENSTVNENGNGNAANIDQDNDGNISIAVTPTKNQTPRSSPLSSPQVNTSSQQIQQQQQRPPAPPLLPPPPRFRKRSEASNDMLANAHASPAHHQAAHIETTTAHFHNVATVPTDHVRANNSNNNGVIVHQQHQHHTSGDDSVDAVDPLAVDDTALDSFGLLTGVHHHTNHTQQKLQQQQQQNSNNLADIVDSRSSAAEHDLRERRLQWDMARELFADASDANEEEKKEVRHILRKVLLKRLRSQYNTEVIANGDDVQQHHQHQNDQADVDDHEHTMNNNGNDNDSPVADQVQDVEQGHVGNEHDHGQHGSHGHGHEHHPHHHHQHQHQQMTQHAPHHAHHHHDAQQHGHNFHLQRQLQQQLHHRQHQRHRKRVRSEAAVVNEGRSQ